jgi:hypothetical protein
MLKDLTAADWRHIIETVEEQRAAVEPGDDESPEEVIMTSVGYVTVGCNLDPDSGYVQGWGEGNFLSEGAWPQPITGDDAVARCAWDDAARLALLEAFIRDSSQQAECEAYLVRCAAQQLAAGGENVVVDADGDL